MRKTNLRHCAVALAVAALAATAQAQTVTFTTTRVPTSTINPDLEIRGGTRVLGLNDSGQYVGSFGERNWVYWGMPHAFIHGSTDNVSVGIGSAARTEGFRLGRIEGPRYADPLYQYLDLFPSTAPSDFNERVTIPNAINNAGVVVGSLSTTDLNGGPFQPFRYDTTTRAFSVLSVPGATSAYATDINNLGQIVGNFTDATGRQHGFLYDGGAYTVIDRPNSGNSSTRIGGINDAGTIVGSSNDPANPRSFILRGGSFTDFTANGLFTAAYDINNSEQIVGAVGVSGQRRGFVWANGQSVILDLAGNGNSTYAYTINNLGVIGGSIEGGAGLGFLATVSVVPEPAAWALWLGGLAVLRVAAGRRRRQPTPASNNPILQAPPTKELT